MKPRIFPALALSLLLLLSPATSRAALQEMRVTGVGVHDSSFIAEDMALDYAKKRAMYLAVRKLGLGEKEAAQALSKLTPDQFREIIRGTDVKNTKRKGDVSYLDVEVTLVDEALRRALKLPESEAPPTVNSRGILVLPVYFDKGRAYLWEQGNLLRPVLTDELRREAHGNVMLPGGDLYDLRLIDYQNALSVKPEELKPMFERYGAEEIVIAVLTPGQPGTLGVSNILLRRLTPTDVRTETMDVAADAANEPSEMRLAKSASAITRALTQIATSTAERDLALREKAKKIKVRFNYTTPQDLALMQKAIRSDPHVVFLELPTITLARVTGTIYLNGEEDALRSALMKQGVIVGTTEDGWRLSTR